MIIIYPSDNTTNYLEPIITVKSIEPYIANLYRDFTELNFDEIFHEIQNFNPAATVFYLGHGAEEELKISNTLIVHFNHGKHIFKKRKLFLLSCFSGDYIKSLDNQFEVAIGFGNILDSKTDLSYKDYLKYKHEDYKCIYQFRLKLVSLIRDSLINAYEENYTFLELYYILRLRMNKIISFCSLSKDDTARLVGELMFDLKKHMILMGNTKIRING